MRRRLGSGGRWVWAVWLALWVGGEALAGDAVRIYIDADRTVAKAAGLSIEQGLRTALAEAGDSLAGRPVEIVVKDHRGSSPRSKRHLQQYLADPQALAVFAGLHSPPLLAHRDFINEQGILVLDPWAAAGPITRYPAAENWIFRLSVDDTKAGQVIVRHAVVDEGYKRPFLLLEDTGWGKSNERTMGAALKALGLVPAGTQWFRWGLSKPRARSIWREVQKAGADAVLLVANAAEAQVLIGQMLDMDLALPIFSHWGITGGDFSSVVDASMRRRLSLAFIQTRYSFISYPDDSLGAAVLKRARGLFPEAIDTAADIAAPTGFVHAYDLGRILVAAVDQAGLSGTIVADRRNVRQALEELEEPVPGLIKTYRRPFGVYSNAAPDAHEALGLDDLVMARYDDKGRIVLLKAPPLDR